MIALGSEQPVGQLAVGERPADDLQEPAADERVLGPPAQALRAGQAPGQAGAVLVDRGGQVLERVDARDLLDQVGLPHDVRAAPVRHADAEAVRHLADGEAERA